MIRLWLWPCLLLSEVTKLARRRLVVEQSKLMARWNGHPSHSHDAWAIHQAAEEAML